MAPFRIAAALLALIGLSACFYSEVPLIPAGEQVTLPYDRVILCMADDCRTVTVDEDGVYVVPPPEDEADEKPLLVRFTDLIGDDDNPVYLAEAEMQDDPEVSYHYLVAHIRTGAQSDLPTYEFAMPSCNDAPREYLEDYGVVRADSYSCKVMDLGAFKAYLAARHGEDFNTDAFWEED